jgi:hypothetical protein
MPFDIAAYNAVAGSIRGAAGAADETMIIDDVFWILDRERRTDQNQIESFKQSLVLTWHGVALGHLSGKCLHRSWWGSIGDQHSPSIVSDKCPCMRQVSWREDGTSRSQRQAMVTNFKEELPL